MEGDKADKLRQAGGQLAERGRQSHQWLHKYGFRRTKRIKHVKRFLLGWLAIWTLIIGVLLSQFDSLAPHYLAERQPI